MPYRHGTPIANDERMSGKNNVNPGQYKVGGRDKPDDQARERMKGARAQASKNIPPQARVKQAEQEKKTR